VAFAPGRVTLLGDHGEAYGGSVLAAPTAEGVHAAVAVRPDRRVVLHALDARATDTFGAGDPPRTGRAWGDLARAAFAALAASWPRLAGMDLAVHGDLEPGRGLGASTAFVVSLLRAVLAAIGEERDAREVAGWARRAEREALGRDPGFAAAWVVARGGAPGEVFRVDPGTGAPAALALPPGTRLETADAGRHPAPAETPGGRREADVAAALRILQRAAPGLVGLVHAPAPAIEALPDLVRDRARHVVGEARRARAGHAALLAGDAAALGRAMDESHRSLSESYGGSTPSIDTRVAERRADPACLGARLMGPGWGGSIVALVRGA
jgi:galactokinase